MNFDIAIPYIDICGLLRDGLFYFVEIEKSIINHCIEHVCDLYSDSIKLS